MTRKGRRSSATRAPGGRPDLRRRRFEKELLAERPAAHCSQAQQRLLALLRGRCPQETVEAFLRGLPDSDRSLLRQLRELLDLFRAYRSEQVAAALQKALAAHAFGADYVAHLLHQTQSAREPQPPLQLRDPELNQLATDPLSLLDYDVLILKSERNAPMTLEEKLRQLTLTTMAQKLETMSSRATRLVRHTGIPYSTVTSPLRARVE